jgi:hypothetical protein
MTSRLLFVALVTFASGSAGAQAADSAKQIPEIAGTWHARNFRSSNGQTVTVVLQLSQRKDSLLGQFRLEMPMSGDPHLYPVWGQVRGDSVLLVDAQRIPVLAAQLTDRRLIGRMAGSAGRLNRGVRNLTSVSDGRPIRLERQ